MTGLLKHREYLTDHDLKARYDVVIVGGGVNGLSLAFHLAEYHGVRDVAVLERNYIGSGGFGRNTQVVRANYNTPETVPLYATSLGMYRTLSPGARLQRAVLQPGRAGPVPLDRHPAGRTREGVAAQALRRAHRHPDAGGGR